MNSTGILTLAILASLVLFASSRGALIGLLGGVLYTTLGQGIEVMGMNIYPLRVLLVLASCRTVIRGEWKTLRLNAVDRLVLLTFSYVATVYILNDNGSAKTMIGESTDFGLAYFLTRCLLRSTADLEWLLHGLGKLLVPYVALLLIEAYTGSNPFSAIGGIASVQERSGRPRCIGSFGHAALLGTFGASFIPLYFAMTTRQGARVSGVVGMSLCMSIVVLSNSGGPLTCALIAVAGSLMWRFREHMPAVRKFMMALLVLLAVLMRAPIWYLPSKMSDLTGGDGWHRSYLMEAAFNQIDRWWLWGMPASATRDWFPYRLASGEADIINYYIAFGLSAGIPAIGLLCGLLVRVYSRLGRAMAALRASSVEPSMDERWLWAWGVVLSVHVSNWFGLVYFDQYRIVFFFQLAAMSTLAHGHGQPALVSERRRARLLKTSLLPNTSRRSLP